jgi:protein-S-isoprenylcysteine O-methyltransferase Ste14
MEHKELFDFVRDQITADPSQSKKFIMAIVGVNALLLVFVGDILLFVFRKELAPQLVALSTILIPSIAGVVTIYLGAQGAVEVKANGVLQQQAKEITK